MSPFYSSPSGATYLTYPILMQQVMFLCVETSALLPVDMRPYPNLLAQQHAPFCSSIPQAFIIQVACVIYLSCDHFFLFRKFFVLYLCFIGPTSIFHTLSLFSFSWPRQQIKLIESGICKTCLSFQADKRRFPRHELSSYHRVPSMPI